MIVIRYKRWSGVPPVVQTTPQTLYQARDNLLFEMEIEDTKYRFDPYH
jgi:hypothetical protein